MRRRGNRSHHAWEHQRLAGASEAAEAHRRLQAKARIWNFATVILSGLVLALITTVVSGLITTGEWKNRMAEQEKQLIYMQERIDRITEQRAH